MKKLLLVLCMIACMFSLAACGDTEEKNGLEDETAQNFKTTAQNLIETIVGLDDEGLKKNMEYFSEDGQEPNSILYNALQAWEGIKGETGTYSGMDQGIVTLNEEGRYVADFTGTFEKRTVNITVIANSKTSAWELVKFDPVYTLGEKMKQAGMNTLMGMGTVFVVLIIMILCISCFSFIPKLEERFKKKKELVEVTAVALQEPLSPPSVTEEELTDDLELAAVITAAIAASENTTTDGLIVRSIRRVNTNKWKRA